MSAASIAIPKTPNSGIAAFAAALPVDLSHSPLFGILGVVMGAGVVTLAGRLLTLGAADLRGHRGLSFDDGAWMGSAFNMALMFIGPLTVYLGGLLGPRRVLLTAASVFTLVSLALPFAQSYSVLIFLLIFAGLSSGTFYPLTVTFAPWLYGIFRNHDAWQWMFWTQAVITPLMMLCIHVGIPAAPATKRTVPAPSFAGFLYASAGLAFLFAALD